MSKGKSGWLETIAEIRDLKIDETQPWGQFFAGARRNLLNAYDFQQTIESDPELKGFSLEELQQKNHGCYAEIIAGSQGYDVCFANPDYAVKKFELKLGQLASTIYASFRQSLFQASAGNFSELLAGNRFFLKLYNLWQTAEISYETMLSEFKHQIMDDFENRAFFQYFSIYSPDYDLYKKIIESADFSDARYLFRIGMYVSPETIEQAEFVRNYPEEELKTIAQNHVNAYLTSFVRKNQDYRKKKFAKVHCPLGMEKLSIFIGRQLEKAGLTPVFVAPHARPANEQYGYDQRFQNAFYLNEDFARQKIESFTKVINNIREDLRLISGSVVVLLFGEEPFVPKMKDSVIRMSEEQDKLQHEMQSKMTGIWFEAAPRHETSFSMISFPSVEIGENFAEIFRDTLELNNLDSAHYEQMQEHMIEILDKAAYVEVKGKEGNETDIRVQLQTLHDPEKQTNFINCGADVNIPVGEVFTSPKLTGTDGVLHVDDTFLFGFRYYNLKITFKNGMIEDYSCTNFENSADGRRYIFDNLLKPNKTLPIGEFAIGTNTLAYRMAQKYGIQHLMPILIVEKMGPHFAIGDTCFVHEEDAPHIGVVSGKSMIATENEKSCQRKTNPKEAYTHKHVDITLPYDMLAEITAVHSDGTRVPIILDGLFVVAGTEELNVPLLQMKQR